MDIKFSKDDGGSQQQGAGDEKGKQNVLLVVLLFLVAGFGYIYFFTDLIKPSQEQKVAEVPPISQVVKKPLPVPGVEPAKVGTAGGEEKQVAAIPVKPEPVKPESVKSEPVKSEPVKVATAPAVAKPVVQEAAKPKEVVKKAEVTPPAVKKPLPVAAKAGEIKPASENKKQPPVVDKKLVPAKDGSKKIVEEKKPVEKVSGVRADASTKPKKELQKSAVKEPVASGAAVLSASWTVLIGNYVLEEALVTDLGRVRKAGLQAYVVPGIQKKAHMNRLFLGEFTSRASAQVELDKLKKHTSDAFMIDSAGKHAVYAGSYLVDERAMFEKGRLTAAGFSLTVKRADVSIPTKNLTAGSFADKNAADETLNKLRAAGVKATLLR